MLWNNNWYLYYLNFTICNDKRCAKKYVLVTFETTMVEYRVVQANSDFGLKILRPTLMRKVNFNQIWKSWDYN